MFCRIYEEGPDRRSICLVGVVATDSYLHFKLEGGKEPTEIRVCWGCAGQALCVGQL